jgi:hypothetical protein
MIQPLRAAHRAVFLAWSVFLPALFAGGLACRHSWRQVPRAENGERQVLGTIVWERTEALEPHKVRLRLLRGEEGSGSLVVQFVPDEPVVAPDVLVYWSQKPGSPGFPEDAKLLGSFHPMERYALPAGTQETGYAILYSLAQQRTLGTFSLSAQP